MNQRRLILLLTAAAVVATSGYVSLTARQLPGSLAGNWTLNRDLSQFPSEVGFGMDVIPAGSGERAGTEASDLARAVRSNNALPVSEDQARNTRQLIAEVKDPPPHLTIVQSDAAVTMTDDRGHSRTFHVDGRQEFQTLEAGPVTTITRWDGARLVVRYKVQPDRELRYTYTRKAGAPQIVVQVQFVERGGRDAVTRVYESTKPGELGLPDRGAPSTTVPPTAGGAGQGQVGLPPAGPGPGGQGGPPRLYQPGSPAVPGSPPVPNAPPVPVAPPVAGAPVVPSSARVPVSPDRAAAPPSLQVPDAELKGLTSLGVVVEDLSSEATSCGLRQATLESTVSKSLSDAGLKVVTNSDEDTYLYVRVVTTAMSTGFCFSRYDAALYTHTMATLTYGSAPVLVQVELMRNGGIAGGGASGHGASVVRNIKQYVDAFAVRVRDANK
jgi:hypothetical protein